jgi:hypothetical protein
MLFSFGNANLTDDAHMYQQRQKNHLQSAKGGRRAYD